MAKDESQSLSSPGGAGNVLMYNNTTLSSLNPFHLRVEQGTYEGYYFCFGCYSLNPFHLRVEQGTNIERVFKGLRASQSLSSPGGAGNTVLTRIATTAMSLNPFHLRVEQGTGSKLLHCSFLCLNPFHLRVEQGTPCVFGTYAF